MEKNTDKKQNVRPDVKVKVFWGLLMVVGLLAAAFYWKSSQPVADVVEAVSLYC